MSVAGTIDAIVQFSRMHAEASDGMQHLKNIEAMASAKGGVGSLLTPTSLAEVHTELAAAEKDFSALRAQLNSPGGTIAVGAHLPVLGSSISSAGMLASAADEACLAGLVLTQSGQTLLSVMKSGFFAQSGVAPPPGSTTLDAKTLAQLKTSFDDALQHLDLGIAYAQHADLSTLPSSLVKPKQLSELHSLIANWPAVHQQLAQVDGWLSVAPSLLGVTSPDHLLLTMMDRSEMRATGGFMGNYAVATIQNGKVQPFSLVDTYLLDGPYIARATTPLTPPPAYSWWPFGGFALRDSNLSADFPTSAQLALHELQLEGGGNAQGMVSFTPVAIERILQVVGNVAVPEYGEVATPTNLEALIHKYQQLLAKGEAESSRKQFTALLAQNLLQKLRGLPSSSLLKVGQEIQTSIRTKDIQMYFSDKNAENLLAETGNDGSITRGPGDGVTIVDDNVGVNKANQFVVVHYTDVITLDAHGTATHNLTITYTMNGHGNPLLFGLNRYLTYLRVYTPPNAKLQHMDGFNFTQQGPNQINHSDFPGRQMWAGYVYILDDSSYSLHFKWIVPNAATEKANQWFYQVDFQHQAGSTQQLTLTVTTAGSSKPLLAFNGPLIEDERLSTQPGGNA